MQSFILDSLYIFLKLLYGGQDALEHGSDPVIKDDDDTGDNEMIMTGRVLSVVQDLVNGVSEGKRWTPKHIGLGCSLHQATRSK